MPDRKLMMIAIFIVGLLAVGAVSAADIACEDNSSDAIVPEPVSTLSATDGNDELEGNSPLAASGKTFTDLNTTINANPNENVIYLNEDYTYDANNDTAFVKGITISRSLTIFGNGVTINATDAARIFQVTGGKVVFNNITFANGRVYGVSDSGSGGAILGNGNAFAINCTFTKNFAQDSGGAMDDGNATDCIFTNNYANYDGGAMDDGNATNCIFINNSAGGAGGAFSSGIAFNCIFINNSGDGGGAFSYGISSNCIFINNYAYPGGAFSYGIASNCIFINNFAYRGGAIFEGNAINCTFTNNYAGECGGAIFEGNATGCTFIINHANDTGNHYDNLTTCVDCTEIDSALLKVSNFTTTYRSGEKLPFSLTNATEIIKGAYTKITLLQTGEEYYAFTGQDLHVDLKIGTYDARFAIIFYNGSENPHVEPQTVKIEITSDGTTFSDLNRTINNNTDSVINLDKNYTYNPDTDSAFMEGIVIDRQVTINGNGCTIDADGKARIFKITSEDVVLKGITFANGNARYSGGAVYFYSNGSVINCNFVNNTSKDEGGAIYFVGSGNVTSCNFNNNSASDLGGAIRLQSIGNVANCNFANNSAGYVGGAISMPLGSVTDCNFVDNKVTDGDSFGGAVCSDYNCEVINCNFVDNKATGVNSVGGAVFFGNNCKVTNCNFTDNKAHYCGAVYFKSEGNLTNCSFTNNSAFDYGGAVCFTKGGTVTDCNFTNNTAANGNGGAIYWNSNNAYISNCCFVNNTASNGGANYFENDLFNSNINAEFINNTADKNGGANYFNGALNNVNIKGDYTSNTAIGVGGANLFGGALNNVDIIGNYTSNKANDRGGANFFAKELTNVTISGDYTNNTAQLNGGAYYVIGRITNLTIIGDYTSNTAGNVGIIIFQDSINYLNVIGAFVNNSGQSVIHFIRPVTNSVVRDSIFLNNNVSNIIGGPRKIQIINSWFGNNATNYNEAPRIGLSTLDNWLFLNATADPNTISLTETSDIIFTLYSYDKNTKNVTDYDNSLLPAVEMAVKATNGDVNDSIVKLGEPVKFTPNSTGNGSITAAIENVAYTFVLKIAKEDIPISIDVKDIYYNETVNITARVNDDAKGNITLKVANESGIIMEVTLPVVAGEVNLSVDNLASDNYTVYADYSGDGRYNENSTNEVFKVKQFTPKITIDPVKVNPTANATIIVNIDSKATGNVMVNVNNTDYTARIEGGIAKVVIDRLKSGNYSIEAYYPGDRNFTQKYGYGNLTVEKLDSDIKVVGRDINVTDVNGVMFTVTLPENASGTLNISGASSINVTECGVRLNNTLVINITNSAYPAGRYDWTFTYLGDDVYANSSAKATSNILVIKSQIVPANSTLDLLVGDTSKITYSITPAGASGNVTFTSSDSGVVAVDSHGNVRAVGNGSAIITIGFGGNANYSQSNATVEVNVSKVNITLDLNITGDLVVGDTVNLTFTLPSDIDGSLIVTVDGEPVVGFTFENGTVNVPGTYGYGNHTAAVSLTGDTKYDDISASVNFTVSKVDPSGEIKIIIGNVSYGENATFEVTLPSDAGGNVTVSVNGTNYTCDVVDGKATVQVPDLGVGNHTLIITYSGDDKYDPVTEKVNVTVKKSTPKLTAKAKTFKNTDKTKKYTVTLKDRNGKPIANAVVSLKVNGKTYTAKTNSKGQATFKLTKLTKMGTFTAVITYKGDDNYNKVSKKVKLTVKQTWKTIAKGSSYHSMVKKIQIALKAKGYYLTYNGRYLKVDGIFHTYTEMAVKQFQKANKLKVTGKVDYATAVKLGLVR